MAYINLPNTFSHKRVKVKGEIEKGVGGLILTDLYNTDEQKLFTLNTSGVKNYVVDVYNTYLFIIGSNVNGAIMNPKRVDYLSKIIKFEYLFRTSSKQLKKIDINSHIFTLTSKERWLSGSVLKENVEDVYFILNNIKTHLNGSENPYIKQMLLLQDNENGFGLSQFALAQNILIENHLLVQKDSTFSGYIIKYCHSDFDGNFM